MSSLHRIRCLVFAAAVLVLTALAARPARAGTLQVRDDAHVLSAADVNRLKSVVGAAPFDGRLVVTSEYADPASLSHYVGSLVAEPNMLVVGIDPQHHRVEVHFGVGARIPDFDRPSIEKAGNDAFRRADWEAGAAAIFETATHDVASSRVATPMQPAPVSRSSVVVIAMLALLLVAVVSVLFEFGRRRWWYSGPPTYPTYGPPPGGGMGALGGGIVGAGIGGVAGYELGKMEGEREERDRERGYGGAPPIADDPAPNYDGGGGGSSWDDGGSNGGGGFDGGGGGGSDF